MNRRGNGGSEEIRDGDRRGEYGSGARVAKIEGRPLDICEELGHVDEDKQ